MENIDNVSRKTILLRLLNKGLLIGATPSFIEALGDIRSCFDHLAEQDAYAEIESLYESIRSEVWKRWGAEIKFI